MIVCVAINKLFIKNTFVMHPFTPETENIEFNEVTKNMIKPFFITNLEKINIFSLSLIRKLKQDATRDA
jgi:hypothetical protein